MYIVLDGEADIVTAGNRLEAVSAGSIFGEMVLTGAKERSSTAVAKIDCIVAAIDERRFSFFVQNISHFAIQVMKLMVARLRLQTQLAAAEFLS